MDLQVKDFSLLLHSMKEPPIRFTPARAGR
jgi:hypothetical protein